MTKPFQEWTVLPHGKLTALDDNLLTVTGKIDMPFGEGDRRMTVTRLTDGRLAVYSAIALDEAEMEALERFGTPAYLIAPNDLHRLDLKPWKDRYPWAIVVAPPAAREKVAEIVPVDATTVDFGDAAVHYFVVAGTGEREAGLLVEGRNGTTLVLNDIIFNLANHPGFGGWLMKLMGMTGDAPKIPKLVKMREVKDDRALAVQLAQLARTPNLTRVVISHGPIIEHDARAVLTRIAHDLAA